MAPVDLSATPLEELRVGLSEAGIDFQELGTTSIAADSVTFITVRCSVGMVDRFHFGPPDPNVTSQFVFDAQGTLDPKRSAFNLGLVLDTAEARMQSTTVMDLAAPSEQRGASFGQEDMALPPDCLPTCDWRGGPIHAPDCPNTQ